MICINKAARNIIFLSFLIEPDQTDLDALWWRTYYNLHLARDEAALFRRQLDRLIEASKPAGSGLLSLWKSGSYGQAFEVLRR